MQQVPTAQYRDVRCSPETTRLAIAMPNAGKERDAFSERFVVNHVEDGGSMSMLVVAGFLEDTEEGFPK